MLTRLFYRKIYDYGKLKMSSEQTRQWELVNSEAVFGAALLANLRKFELLPNKKIGT